MIKFCHKDPSRILTMGKTVIWGGSKDGIISQSGWSLVISALGKTSIKRPFAADENAQKLLPDGLFNWVAPPQVSLEWPDGGVPAISREWWQELAKALPEVGGNIGCFCQGGHGRTGTMLSILYVLSGGSGDPVKAIRKRYCSKAVETEEQIEYIEQITGRKTRQAGSYESRYDVGYKGSGSTKPHGPQLPWRADGRGSVMPE